MAYDFTTTGDGNIQVAQGGQNVATVTPGLAASQYGYVAPVSTKQAAVSSPSVISSATGADIVQQQAAKLSTIAAGPTQPVQYNYVNGKAVPVDTTNPSQVDTTKPTGGASGGADTNAPAPTKITLINPNTEQTVTFEDASINKDNIQSYLDSGYSVSEASGTIPSWLQPGGVKTDQTPADKAQADIDTAATDLKTLTDNLTKYTVSDADLKGQTDAITAQWDARIADMTKINSTRKSAINTLGIRLGSRYAGGSGGTFGGIVSEEERQGVVRIGDLEAQKQAAIAAAKQAALTQNWQVYSKQVDLAEKSYSDKITAMKDLQAATAAQNKAIQDTLHQQQTDYYNQVEKPINDVLTSAAKNGAPKEVQDAISAELDKPNPNIAAAIQAAGDYLQDVPTSGIVGEYLFYTKQAKLAGQTPVDFNEYQNIDANRKKSIAAAGNASGLSTQVLGKVLTVADQFDGEQIVKDYNTTATQVTYIAGLGKAPTDDMARVYAFAKVMDPNSVVRESEYATVQQYAQAVLQGAGLKAARIFTNSGFLTDEARGFINKTLQSKLATQKKTYDNVYNEYGRRVDKITGQNDGTDYITDYSQGYDTTGTLIKDESSAQQAVTDFGTTNPDARQQILSLAGVPQASLGGRAYTWQEIAQILGIK